ncbi:MAG: TolC family protein [Bacteroidetes bacterium]|nr:TolC family protein [Bacteroidota bacterium]
MRNLLLMGLLAYSSLVLGQTKSWTLEQCIQYAIDNNLDVKLSQLTAEQSKITHDQSKLYMVPDLNSNLGQYYQSGRSIDRYTNTFVKKGIYSGNYGLSSGLTLFAGGSIRNNIEYTRYLWMASEQDVKSVEQNISLNVANLFLQIAQAKELIESSKQNIANTKAQLERAEIQFAAGSINEGQVLNLKAQMANDETNMVNAENQEANALVSLKMLLRLPLEENFTIALPTLGSQSIQEYPETLVNLYTSAASRRPDILAADLRVQGSTYYKKYTKGSLYPTLSLGLNLNSVYSSNASTLESVTQGALMPIGIVKNTNEIVEAPLLKYNYSSPSYTNQLKSNFGQSVGLNLSIPVFNRFSVRNNYKFASLDLERTILTSERTKQNLYNEVAGVFTAYNAAMKKYKAAALSEDAQKKNLDFIQKRFDGGQGSATDLQIAKANYVAANANFVSAKYEYVFRKLILDFYMGKKLEIN